MTITRKLKGIRKVNNTSTSDSETEQTSHSTSQMSYDQRTNTMDLLISQLQNTPNYNPNEIEFKVATLQAMKVQMLQATQSVANSFVPLNSARNTRNELMCTFNENLVDIFNKTKDYLYTILDYNSLQYKAISKIKFKKA